MTRIVGVVRGLAAAGLLLWAACGSDRAAPGPDGGAGGDAGPVDAGIPRLAPGTRLLDHAAVVGGITSDGYVVYCGTDAMGHSVAKVMPIDGGDSVTIASSTGTGKADIRFDIEGSVVFVWDDRGNRVATLTV